MNERDFEIGDKKFKLSKIDTMRQFHIVRRLGPILGEIIPVMKKIQTVNVESMTEDDKLDQFAKIAEPLMNGIAKLSDKDADFVILNLCSAVEMHQPEYNTWAKVVKSDVFMIQNLELPLLLQIAGRALGYNLGGFFATAQQTSHAAR